MGCTYACVEMDSVFFKNAVRTMKRDCIWCIEAEESGCWRLPGKKKSFYVHKWNDLTQTVNSNWIDILKTCKATH